MRKLALLLFMLLTVRMAQAQGGSIYGQALTPAGYLAKNAPIRVCLNTSTGVPCSPLVSVYSDPALGHLIPQPSTDVNGNYSFFVSAGYYSVQVQTGPSSYSVYNVAAVAVGGGGGLTEPLNLTQPMTGTSATFSGLVTANSGITVVGPTSGQGASFSGTVAGNLLTASTGIFDAAIPTVTVVGTDVSGQLISRTTTGSGSTVALANSPAFTNTPTAPTAAPGTNTTQLATTAFVQAAGGAGTIANQVVNVVPLATAANALAAPSHISDQLGSVTISEPLQWGGGASIANSNSHGSAGIAVQMSDNTGAAGNCAKFTTDGSVTDSGIPCFGGVVITNTATQTVSGVSNYYYNQIAAAASAITYTLPTPRSGAQFCFKNSNNGSAATTGTLKILVANTGTQSIILNGTQSSSGFIQSSGAAGDAACVIGISVTQWEAYISVGVWTLH